LLVAGLLWEKRALVPARIYRDRINTPGRLLLLVHVMHHRASAAASVVPSKAYESSFGLLDQCVVRLKVLDKAVLYILHCGFCKRQRGRSSPT
jgi:hypothetical protein